MEKRYKVLRFVASLYKIIAWILLILGILSAIGSIITGAAGGGVAADTVLGAFINSVMGGVLGFVLVGLGALIASLLLFVMYYAVGELIYVLIATEQNTRETAYYLRGESTLPPPPRTI